MNKLCKSDSEDAPKGAHDYRNFVAEHIVPKVMRQEELKSDTHIEKTLQGVTRIQNGKN